VEPEEGLDKPELMDMDDSGGNNWEDDGTEDMNSDKNT
jgi:hypothetical protein